MARHTDLVFSTPSLSTAGDSAQRRKMRRRGTTLPMFASFAALAFVLVSVTSPMSQNDAAAAAVMAQIEQGTTQNLAVGTVETATVSRDSYGVTGKPEPVEVAAAPEEAESDDVVSAEPEAPATAPVAGTPDPGSAQAIAHDMVLARGWGEGEFSCLVSLWNKESGWNTFAANPSSGAYGIPQSLPGNKMASAGGDWATNPATQITWGLGYIADRYGSPCGAWGASQAQGWY
ncbi:lytic transglycosylase domain-containing protein [Marisediminicola sp. LYQ134]|uniref:aggregation-promoting factor C-terminal-like domain-containing protein n=1 Tax=Marisediminicola sp. LYQ134 TaxID=3391061 RepID=UPI0039838FCD